MSESQIKKDIQEYLQLGELASRWFWLRLNSGRMKVGRHIINFCPKGTADLVVFKANWDNCRVIFLETKDIKGKQTPEQEVFQLKAEYHNAEYYVVRSVEEVMKILSE